jgi:hypothetical protein
MALKVLVCNRSGCGKKAGINLLEASREHETLKT